MTLEDFKRIRAAFKEKDEQSMQLGSLPMRSTKKGFWGTSNLDDVYNFFLQKNFDKDTQFLDLGAGDGRVVLVAGLFVQARGVECDEALVAEGRAVASKLGLEVDLVVEDMRNIDFSCYEVLYSYADQQWDFLKHKLLRELSGELYCYHDTYHPRFLEKGRITWIGQIPIYCYTHPGVTRKDA